MIGHTPLNKENEGQKGKMMKDHVTSLETSKKFMKVGIRAKHLHYWLDFTKRNKPAELRMGTAPIDKDIYPAYLLSELLAMVEGSWALCPSSEMYLVELETGMTYNASMIEAVAQAILWQRENHA